jgi:hypothetical protein
MKAYRARADDEAVARVYGRHIAALQELGIDDVGDTVVDLRDEALRPRLRASSLGRPGQATALSKTGAVSLLPNVESDPGSSRRSPWCLDCGSRPTVTSRVACVATPPGVSGGTFFEAS